MISRDAAQAVAYQLAAEKLADRLANAQRILARLDRVRATRYRHIVITVEDYDALRSALAGSATPERDS